MALRNILHTHFYTISFTLLGVCIAVLAAALIFEPTARPLNVYLDEIAAACADAPHRPTCYEKVVPEYYEKLGFDAMFELIGMVQRLDPSYGYCHLSAHRVAEYEVSRDPARWMDVMVECPPSGMCANGCMHGALITRFVGAEAGMTEEQINEVIADVDGACEPRPGWSPSGLDKGNCYHGLGHLAMYMTLGDLDRSLMLCDQFAKRTKSGDMSELCYGGVFMQLFQPLDPEDEAMVAHIEVSKENFASFCNQFPKDGGRSSCFARGSMLFENSTTHGPEIHAFCEQSGDTEIIEACYDMVFALVGSGSEYNVEKIGGICETVNMERRGQCYGMAAINMIDADPAFVPRMAELCDAASEPSVTNTCFEEVGRYAPYRFNETTPEFAMLCTTLPAAHRNGACIAYK